ncbi:MAG: hypothetical protein K9M96_18305 [Deltaproteobacteria bacterium]|nr:hypothetical protein [Deltaproteobacteria bacterium]
MECAVIGKKDPKWGEIPKAIVVLKPGAEVTCQEISAYSRENLSHFKALWEAEIIDERPRGAQEKCRKVS